LSGVTAISTTDVWVVGSPADASSGPVTAHWNGEAWTAVPVPAAPGPQVRHELSAVDATASGDVWAVGSARTGAGPTTPGTSAALALRFDGRAWAVVPTPAPRAGVTALNDVDLLSSAAGWAVGAATEDDGVERPLILRWQADRWTDVPAPRISAELTSVHATSDRDVWAVGSRLLDGGTRTGLVLHWDGVAWREAPVPVAAAGDSQRLAAVAASSATDVWAVGRGCPTNELRPCLPLALRLVDGAWRPVPTSGDGTEFVDLLPFAADDLWAVGYATVLAQGETDHAEHWDGQRFTTEERLPVPGPATGNGELSSALSAAAAVPGTDELWAVGWVSHPSGAVAQAIRRGPVKP
jgi:hypothetical protein